MKTKIGIMELKDTVWGKALTAFMAFALAVSMLAIAPIFSAVAGVHTHNEDGWVCVKADDAKTLACAHQHDDACGYVDGQQGSCAHEHTDACYVVTEGKWTCTPPAEPLPEEDPATTPADKAGAAAASFVSLDDFYAALDAMGDADDEASVLAALDNIAAVYNRLSADDKTAVADEWAYVQSYRESVSAGNPDEGIQTMASGYEPVTTVGIYPDGKPAGSTATGKVRQTGQSLTMKVGQRASFIQAVPTKTLFGSACGHTLAVYNPSDYCSISLIDNSGKNIVGNPTYAAANNNGARVFDTQFEALKPGTSSDVRVCYYANFSIVLTNGANSAYVPCPRCGRSCLVYKDETWYRYNDVFGITVNADYVLNYDTQDGSAVAPTTKTVADTSATLNVTGTVPIKDGYRFNGWAETENGAVKYKAGDSVSLTWSEGYGSEANPVSKTLYAVWEEADPNEVTYRIDREYWINGEKIATVPGTNEKGTAGDEVVGADLDKENTGWRTRRVEGEKRTFDYAGSNPETLTLTADGTNVITLKYEINDVVEKTYTVVYKDGANGDAFGDESHGNLKEGDATPAFEGSTARTGYTFQGWTPDVEDTVVSDMANDDGEIIYTAKWLKNERKITVTWKDGYTDDPIKVEKVKKGITDEELEELYPADPERDGYVFNGWGDPETDEDGNITITAKWKKETPKTKITVTWVDEDGTTVLDGPKTFNKGETEPTTDVTPTKAEDEDYTYKFAGWERSEDENGNVTYTATYTATPKTYTVTYTDGVDGEEIFADQVTGELLSGIATPSFEGTPAREGYVFVGWDPKVADTVSGDATYVAQWEPVDPGNADDPEDPEDPTPTPGVTDPDPDDPTPTPEEPTPGPDTPEEPGTTPDEGTEGTPDAPAAPTGLAAIVAPIADAAAAIVAPVVEAIGDLATPLADADETIVDEDNPLFGLHAPDCWTHWLMILGALVTISYCLSVLYRRRSKIHDMDDFEDGVLGKNEERETVTASMTHAAHRTM